MGFYGNVSNITRSTFQFDKIYANRTEMDANVNDDNIYLGRYVLVEYDTDTDFNVFERVFLNKETGKFYSVKNSDKDIDLIKGVKGKYYFTADEDESASASGYNNVVLYRCEVEGASTLYTVKEAINSDIVDEETTTIQTVTNFIEITNIPAKTDNYATNYNIDMGNYKNSRGYDSTVWMKTYAGDTIKYAMIAELNTVVPTFDITADAPTDNPVPPHFDGNSTNVYYNLHMQSPWGFRIAEAKLNDPSDENVIWNETTLNIDKLEDGINYNNANSLTITKTQSKKRGNIFYNKAGFNPWYETKVSGSNSITLTPAKSGNVYNMHDRIGQEPQDDTKELSILLPSLGNTVCDMWNIIYGPGDPRTHYRNLDIEWNSTKGHRMITLDDDGYKFKPTEANTLAGIINSTHDLMGMIVETEDDIGGEEEEILIAEFNELLPIPDDETDDDYERAIKEKEWYYNSIAKSNSDKIYYSNTKKNFYIKQPTYQYTEVENGKSEDTYEEIALSPWIPNHYYYVTSMADDGKTVLRYNKDTSQNATYNREYCSLQIDPVKVVMFQEDVYYRKNYSDYELIKDAEAGNEAISKNNLYTIEVSIETDPENAKIEFYQPNMYYYIEDGKIIIETGTSLNPNRNYYKVVGFEGNKVLTADVILKTFKSGVYYIKNEDKYELLTSLRNDVPSYTIKTSKINTDKIASFYIGEDNPWYYIEGSRVNKMTEDTDYDTISQLYSVAQIEDETLKHDFYIPGLYYYANGLYDNNSTVSMILDYENEPTSGRQYYTYNGLFVIEDTTNHYNIGAPWIYNPDKITNLNEHNLPAGVKVGKREIIYKWTKLEGFAQNLNTIHGLILSINNILRSGDKLTRDTQTVQGAINVLNDIINKFERMQPRQILITNAYGQVLPTGVYENRWLKTEIDTIWGPEVKGTAIEFIHKYRDIEDYTSSQDGYSDKSGVKFADIHGEDYIPDFRFDNSNKIDINNNGDAIDLYTPVIDKQGHVVGRNIETVTLPYGYKQITTSGISNEESKDIYTSIVSGSDIIKETSSTQIPAGTVNKTVANNTQDSFTLNPANKWVQVKIINDAIELAHEIHAIDRVKETTDINDGKTDTITIQDIAFDKAGHAIEDKKHTYTLPYSFKTIQPANSTSVTSISKNANSIAADNTQDTMTISMGNKWLEIAGDANNDKITIAHELHTITTDAKETTNLNGEEVIDKDNIDIPDFTYDEAGHITAKQSHKYTLPFGFKTISINSSTATTPIIGNNNSIVADTTQDTMTISTGNKWLQIAGDIANDKITLAHEIHDITTDAKNTTNLNKEENAENEDNIDIPDFTYDEAGHITAKQSHKYTLPFGFKTVSINSSTAISSISGNKTGIIADSTQDTITISTGNKWLQIAGDASADSITIAHELHSAAIATTSGDLTATIPASFEVKSYDFDNAGHIQTITTNTISIPNNFGIITNGTTTTTASGSQDALIFSGDSHILVSIDGKQITTTHNGPTTATVTSINNAQSPSFGGTFNIPVISYDNKGHVTSVTTNTVSLPDGASGILLTGYEAPTSTATATAILATDSVNVAMAKLQNQINKSNAEIVALQNQINSLKEIIIGLVTENEDGSFTINIPEKEGT